MSKFQSIYRGTDHACRCGCKGSYVTEHHSKAFKQREKQLLDQHRFFPGDGEGEGYLNISLPGNKALCGYYYDAEVLDGM